MSTRFSARRPDLATTRAHGGGPARTDSTAAPVAATTPGVTTVPALTSDGRYRISPTVRYRKSALHKLGIGHHSLPGGDQRV